MQVLTVCLSVAPILLFVLGIFGILGIVQVGPREVPKDHPINRKLGYTFLLLAVGMFLITNPSQTISIAGIVVSILALVIYGYFYREARKEYPEMSPQEWLNYLRPRYKFMNQSGQPKPKDEDKK
jgi:Ca2+/Na+ antiporter